MELLKIQVFGRRVSSLYGGGGVRVRLVEGKSGIDGGGGSWAACKDRNVCLREDNPVSQSPDARFLGLVSGVFRRLPVCWWR